MVLDPNITEIEYKTTQLTYCNCSAMFKSELLIMKTLPRLLQIALVATCITIGYFIGDPDMKTYQWIFIPILLVFVMATDRCYLRATSLRNRKNMTATPPAQAAKPEPVSRRQLRELSITRLGHEF
jgi:hypothetical protein